jgi:lysozyme
MRFSFRLIVWLLIFALGLIAGDRYTLPGWARSIGDAGFSVADRWISTLGQPVPSDADEDAEAVNESDGEVADPAPSSPAPSSPTPSGDAGHSSNANLRMNNAGLEIIEESEGLRLEAYNLGGQWLIGYGHSRTAKAGMKITQAQAEQLLREDVRASEDAVRALVQVPVNENQFSAMVSLAYNMGPGGFSRSTVLEAVNKGNYKKAADNFRNHNKGGGKVIPHLTERREKERTLFLTPA